MQLPVPSQEQNDHKRLMFKLRKDVKEVNAGNKDTHERGLSELSEVGKNYGINVFEARGVFLRRLRTMCHLQ